LKGPKGSAPIAGRLRGENIFFASGETRFSGRVDGDVIEGIARTAGQDSQFKAARIGN
jgi:hypothetical protein